MTSQRHAGGRPPLDHVPESEAVRLLRQWLVDHGMNQADLADKLGISRPRLSRIIRDIVQPRKAVAVAIDKLTGGVVPKHTWGQDAVS